MIDTCQDPLPKLGYFKQLCLPVPTHAVRLKQETKGKNAAEAMCVANRSFSYPSVSCTRSEENCAKKHHAHNQLMPGHNPSKRAYAGRAFALPGHCSAFARQIFK
jgi:hypothetical protein